MKLTVDVICPAFREEQSIGLFHDRLQTVLANLRDRYSVRILYIVDPSPDRTESLLDSISNRDADVQVMVMSRRFGHQAALVAGIDHSEADAIIMLDSDLQHPPELIPQMVNHWAAGADIVQMVRQDGPDTGLLKRLTSRWFYRLLLRIGTVDLPVGAADFRLLSSRVSRIFRDQLQEQNPFLRGLVSWVGFNVVHMPFKPENRLRGNSNYRPWALVNLALNGICSFSKAPLRFAIAAGLIVAGLSLFGGFLQIVLYMMGTFRVPGWPTIVVFISFIAGLQLFFMGILGEYIGFIFDEVKSRPRYLVDKLYPGRTQMAGHPSDAPATMHRHHSPNIQIPDRAALETLVTRRERSMFSNDITANQGQITSALYGKRILIVGGGGSIGAATTNMLLEYRPQVLHVVDQSENYLAELVRDLRGQQRDWTGLEFQALPLDYGGPAMARLLQDTKPYDIVLNFAAIKHVRSEKDVYSALQMLDTNIVRHIRFKNWLAQYGHGNAYFAVSTDKAANPVSLMGASKRLMEDLIFAFGTGDGGQITAARFANVAFSNGSLLDGFKQRITKWQPIAVPLNTRRYFISHREAAEICVLSSTMMPSQHIAVPKLDPESQLQTLESIAIRVLEAYGFTPVIYEDESDARAAVRSQAAIGRWPLLLTPLDTSGEKPYEEFIGHGETASSCGLDTLLAIKHAPSRAFESGLFDQLTNLVEQPASTTNKAEIIGIIATALSSFRHVDTGRNLDQRL